MVSWSSWTFVMIALVAVWLGVVDQVRRSGPPTYASLAPRVSPSPHARAERPPVRKPLSEKRALVTGANGFLGSNLVELLLEDGWTVLAMHRPGSNTTTLREDVRVGAAGRLTLVEGDITDLSSLLAVFPQGLPVVFHVAAQLSQWWGANDRMYRVNVLGTRNVVEACLARGVEKLVHTSSVAVYEADAGIEHVLHEEPLPHRGHTSWHGYRHTKTLAEDEVRAGINDGLWAVFVNPAAIIGPRDTTGFIRMASMLKRGAIPGLASGRVCHSHVRAIASAHIAAAKKGRLGENYVTCTGSSAIRDLAAAAGRPIGLAEAAENLLVLPAPVLRVYGLVSDFLSIFTGREPEVSSEIANFMGMQCTGCDSSKAQAELDFEDTTTLDEQMGDSVRWFVKKGLL